MFQKMNSAWLGLNVTMCLMNRERKYRNWLKYFAGIILYDQNCNISTDIADTGIRFTKVPWWQHDLDTLCEGDHKKKLCGV